MPTLQLLFDAVQLVRVAPAPAAIAKVTPFADAVQFVTVQPAPHERPLVPVLSWTRHDSRTAPGPARIAVEVHPLTSRSRKFPPRAPLVASRQLIPRAKPLIEPWSRLARCASTET